MKRHAKILAAGLFLLTMVASTSISQTQKVVLSSEALAALNYYLNVDCEIPVRRDGLDQLLKFKDVLEPRLISLLKEGPDEESLAGVRRDLEESWSAREKFLAQNPQPGLTEDQLKLARGVSRDEYLEQGRKQFILKYKEKAAIGLAAIGSPLGLRTLREAVAKSDETMRAVINSALKQFQRK